MKYRGTEGFFITPDGKFQEVTEHFSEVREDPTRFGFSEAEAASWTREEDRARVLREVVRRGWIRVRGHRGFTTFDVPELSQDSLWKLKEFLQQANAFGEDPIRVHEVATGTIHNETADWVLSDAALAAARNPDSSEIRKFQEDWARASGKPFGVVNLTRMVETFFEAASDPAAWDEEFTEDVVRSIERNFGFKEVEKVLGSGSFGTASVVDASNIILPVPTVAPVRPPVGKIVFKLTSDPEEVQAAANTIGKPMVNVATVFGAYYLSDYQIMGLHSGLEQQIGVVVLELLAGTRITGPDKIVDNETLRRITKETKETYKVWPDQLEPLSRPSQRQRLKNAQEYLIEALDDEPSEALGEIANGLKELRTLGIYSVDIHPGNVGYTQEGVHKIFDLGVSSSPRTKRPPVLAKNNPAVPILADPGDRWPLVAITTARNPVTILK